MELEELIVEIVIGLFLLFTSYQIGIKENITLLHGYHYTQLDPKDKKVFTKKIGIGTLLVSIGILVMPIINLISHSELGYYIGLACESGRCWVASYCACAVLGKEIPTFP